MSTAFECIAVDADFPSGTMRFQMPRNFPVAGGVYRIERVRTATPEDEQRFANYPPAPLYADEVA